VVCAGRTASLAAQQRLYDGTHNDGELAARKRGGRGRAMHRTSPSPPAAAVLLHAPHAPTLTYLLIAKFHYTGPTGPARTRTTRISEKLRWSVRVSDKVRAGPVGSGRARVVEFSFYGASARLLHSSAVLSTNTPSLLTC